MAEDLRGYVHNEIIRKASGSPASNYAFSGGRAESVMIDNLGSSPIYFNFNSGANPADSGTGFIDSYSFRTFDWRAGSVSIQGSGTTTPEVQFIGLY